MARIAIFASGNGSNFESLVKYFSNDKINKVTILICNKKNAFVIERAKRLDIPYEYVKYVKGDIQDAEEKIFGILKKNKINVIFLAGFMKILTAKFLQVVSIPIINIHPSLLPKYKGVDAIEKAFNSSATKIGITIHYVSEKVDSGEIILQKSIPINRDNGLKFIEQEVHKIEHHWYPIVAKKICDKINKEE